MRFKNLKMAEIPCIIPETGISRDFINEYTGIVMRIQGWESGNDMFDIIIPYSLKKYEERYPLDKYKEVITLKNKLRIRRINSCVEKINQLKEYVNEKKDFSELRSLIRGMHYLITKEKREF